jgi:transposase
MWLWMQQQYLHVLPKSAIGKALAYSLERWHKLSLYIIDGRLKIDNNPVENSIRPVALGRKNYLFAGKHSIQGIFDGRIGQLTFASERLKKWEVL